MADFIPYDKYEKTDRNPDKTVRLQPDRWAGLVEQIRESCGDPNPGDTITVYEPVQVDEILFLPAVYRAA